MKRLILIFAIITSQLVFSQKPTISFTFDDGITYSQGGYSVEEWNQMILQSLEDAKVKAIFFVRTKEMSGKKGEAVISSWDKSGHKIANHTFSHPNYNSEKNSSKVFRTELLKADSVIRAYGNYTKRFRFPYLKEGKPMAKVDSLRQILKEQGYKNGHVTIDASDWYIDSKLRDRLKENPKVDLEPYKAFYLQHLLERAEYYEGLAFKLTGRHIKHTILLHHNLVAALFLDDAIHMFRDKGWNIISANDAYQDPIFNKVPKHAGESLIWALAKDSGKYEDKLRYPAEDGKYEKIKMDALGL